jgi:hypothetical protein
MLIFEVALCLQASNLRERLNLSITVYAANLGNKIQHYLKLALALYA